MGSDWERAKPFPRLSKYLIIWAVTGAELFPLCSCQDSQYLGCTFLSSWSSRIKEGIAEPRCFPSGMEYQKRLRVGGRGQKYQTQHLTWKQRQVGAVELVMDWCKSRPPSEQAHFIFHDRFASWWINSWKSPQKLLLFSCISLFKKFRVQVWNILRVKHCCSTIKEPKTDSMEILNFQRLQHL